MLVRIPDILTPAEVRQAHDLLAQAPWNDGRSTSGEQSALAKNNEQLPEAAEATHTLRQMVLSGLDRSALFLSATLPKTVSPPMFNRYAGATNAFGDHVDNAVRFVRNGGGRVRTDISCTLFLSDPGSYEGGELVIQEAQGAQRIKLAAGSLLVYPGTSVHRVEPVVRGTRLASFFWIQSMVRSSEQRELLFSMDNYLRHLRSTIGEVDPGIVGLTGTYHNLLRLWADV